MKAHGAALIDRLGESVLGYPAVLCTHLYEIRRVQEALHRHLNPDPPKEPSRDPSTS